MIRNARVDMGVDIGLTAEEQDKAEIVVKMVGPMPRHVFRAIDGPSGRKIHFSFPTGRRFLEFSEADFQQLDASELAERVRKLAFMPSASKPQRNQSL